MFNNLQQVRPLYRERVKDEVYIATGVSLPFMLLLSGPFKNLKHITMLNRDTILKIVTLPMKMMIMMVAAMVMVIMMSMMTTMTVKTKMMLFRLVVVCFSL